jgi:hypothetical protein
VASVPRDPFGSRFLSGEGASLTLLYFLSVVLNGTDLLNHARLEGNRGVEERNTDEELLSFGPTPGYTGVCFERGLNHRDAEMEDLTNVRTSIRQEREPTEAYVQPVLDKRCRINAVEFQRHMHCMAEEFASRIASHVPLDPLPSHARIDGFGKGDTVAIQVLDHHDFYLFIDDLAPCV